MKLHILCNGCNHPLRHAFGSAFLLEAGVQCLLFDCGPSTTYKMAVMGIDWRRIHYTFITHHHYDHTAGFPCFVLSRWDKSKENQPPLTVCGPPPTRNFIEKLFGKGGVFYEDWTARIKSPAALGYYQLAGGALPRPEPAFNVMEVTNGPVVDTDDFAVTCAEVRHVDPVNGQPLLTSLAYRIETDSGSIVFAGDCDDCSGLREFSKDVDTLVVKPRAVLPLPFVADGDPDISGMGKSLATGDGDTLEQDGQLLTKCSPHRVVLSHLSPAFFKPNGVRERVLATIGQSYGGLILMPDEMSSLDLQML